MLWLTVLLFLGCGICNVQGMDHNWNKEGYIEDTKCIGQYIDLEMYVLNNKTLVETLAETFFTTGRGASKFVKITYNFQTTNPIVIHSL